MNAALLHGISLITERATKVVKRPFISVNNALCKQKEHFIIERRTLFTHEASKFAYMTTSTSIS